MNTPNLDALMEQAAQVTVRQSSESELAKLQAQFRLNHLFGTHGPALVAVLKRTIESSRWVDAMNLGDATLCNDIQMLLTKLDQEATC